MTEQFVVANGLRLAYDEFGKPEDQVMLLIMGLATQMIAWPESFCEDLARQGYRVIRFDNRDIGLSEKLETAKPPNIAVAALLHRLGLPIRVPYTLVDMADDTVGLLDALNIDRAHLVGVSMGGMIGQLVTARFPERVHTFTSIMSSSGNRRLPAPKPKVTAALMRRPLSDEESYIA
ncbi:MAG: alpha/beta hydrolase, partial [Pseudomonadales bacterium]